MSRFKFFMSGLITFLLAACMPAAAQPTGPSAEEIQAQIATSVALTLTAHAQTQIAAYSPTPQDTPTPTITLTPFPTLTPFSVSKSPTPGSLPPVSPPAYACAVNKAPFDNTAFKKNDSFDIKLWLRNIGTRKWDKGADLMYESGTNFLTRDKRYELPLVNPGDTVGPYIFDARAPGKRGTYTMTFKVQGGFCYPYIKIIVK